MSLDVVGGQALNVNLTARSVCDITHKLTKEYVKTPVWSFPFAQKMAILIDGSRWSDTVPGEYPQRRAFPDA